MGRISFLYIREKTVTNERIYNGFVITLTLYLLYRHAFNTERMK